MNRLWLIDRLWLQGFLSISRLKVVVTTTVYCCVAKKKTAWPACSGTKHTSQKRTRAQNNYQTRKKSTEKKI